MTTMQLQSIPTQRAGHPRVSIVPTMFLCLSRQQAKAFFALLAGLPKDQRPTSIDLDDRIVVEESPKGVYRFDLTTIAKEAPQAAAWLWQQHAPIGTGCHIQLDAADALRHELTRTLQRQFAHTSAWREAHMLVVAAAMADVVTYLRTLAHAQPRYAGLDITWQTMLPYTETRALLPRQSALQLVI